MLEGQVERRLTKLADELPGVLVVAGRLQLVVDGQAHVALLVVIV